jgi:putative transcriptional regulator
MSDSRLPIVSELSTGVLLVASPNLVDPNFKRSVVLLCEHSDAGSFGLILNQNITVEMSELLQDAVHVGGPVQMDTLYFLHRFGDDVDGTVEVCPEVYWGGEFENLQDVIKGKDITKSDVRFYLGYAGWTEGQLQEEIHSDGWIVTSCSSDLVFELDSSELWRSVMIRLGGEFALMANFPDEPRLN